MTREGAPSVDKWVWVVGSLGARLRAADGAGEAGCERHVVLEPPDPRTDAE